MFHRVQVFAAVSLGLALVACSSTPPTADEQQAQAQARPVVRDTITGSNIPRRESSAGKAGVVTVEKDSVENVFTNMPGARPKSN